MAVTNEGAVEGRFPTAFLTKGMLCLVLATLFAGFFFSNGLQALLNAWQLPEYSHGPLIPVLSLLLFLKQLKDYPIDPGPKRDRWVGVCVVLLAVIVGYLGNLARINDIVAYATIIWIGGMLLISFGWETGRHFWPGVLHLVYMLPLPGVVYYKMTTSLQFVSSEVGVWFLQLMSIPVFLDGNIIDLGVMKLHVAEACSGLRYLFPILSFSYIFAALYKGSNWHKAILLLSAAPIAILMNSIRIAVAGYIVNYYGIEWVNGFSHFFEGWVIFAICIALLFLLAWVLVRFNSEHDGLVDALDLNTDGLGVQLGRLQYVRASKAMITAAVLMATAAVSLNFVPDRGTYKVDRQSFVTFPQTFGTWEQFGPRERLAENVARTLGADDYHQVTLVNSEQVMPSVGLFMAWYEDQSRGGVHSPEICLPGAGWEIAWLERTDVADQMGFDESFQLNRAVIQKGETRMMVYYWFEQKGRRIAWDFAAKFYLMTDGIATGRTDGGLVRLTTLIQPDETDAAAEARLQNVLKDVVEPLNDFMPEG